MTRSARLLIVVGIGGVLAGFTIGWADSWGGVGQGLGPWLLGLLVFCLYVAVVFFGFRSRLS